MGGVIIFGGVSTFLELSNYLDILGKWYSTGLVTNYWSKKVGFSSGKIEHVLPTVNSGHLGHYRP